MKKKGLSFQLTMLLVGIAPVFLGILVLALILTVNLEQEIKDGVRAELRVAAEQVKQYFAYDVIANGEVDYSEYSDHEYIESLKGDDIELTLFKDDVRLLTSLKKDDGTYNEGTQANADIYESVKAGNDYIQEGVDINGTKYFVYYMPIYDGNNQFWGMAFAGEPETDLKKAISKAVLTVVIVSIILIAILAVLIMLVARVLTMNLKYTAHDVVRLSEGKLDARFKVNSFVREFNDLVSAGKVLQEQLLSAVGGALSTAGNLGSAVNSVDELAGQSADGANQISRVVNELSTTAMSMAETVQEANTSVMEMGDSIDRISSNVTDMNVSSDASMEANRVAMEYMGKLIDVSEHSVVAVDEISEKIAECSESADKIKSATETIAEIASQTNLLSLNASIEAARAGESGRGFAVVASEIQKLAEMSNESANDIQNIIDEILGRVEECVNKAGEMTVVIKEQMQFLDETRVKIDAMSKTGEELAIGAKAINEETLELMKLKDSVLGAISDLSAISEENAASSQEVTATVDSIASAVESTKDESNTMRQLATDLADKMSFFKLEN